MFAHAPKAGHWLPRCTARCADRWSECRRSIGAPLARACFVATLLANDTGSDMRTDLPSWRSLLFVPVTAEKFVRTGADRGADGIILDLEDAVAPAEKERARTLIADAI